LSTECDGTGTDPGATTEREEMCFMITLYILFIGIRMLCDLFTRGYGDHSTPMSLGKAWMLGGLGLLATAWGFDSLEVFR